ncbi:isochorismate synthase [Oceanobacillus limi]|uniref:Isochorismate synthase MenF n=1 Tax=Oceanobacillus limi TaxID=930131 RepID=A0A1I0DN58_9BACI|nr:isochorismate synthase [Oceanobacillus limi]SET33542.1 isochorismate synthase [Oceanobacillus limi]
MLKVKEDILRSLLDKAIQTIHTNEIKLVSYTKQIDEANPLAFFEAGKYMQGNRTFWKSSIDDYFIVGVGSALELATDNSTITYIENKWQNLLQDAFIHNPYETPGTGIVALGGMAFDPKKERTELWKEFNSSQFTIPAFTLTKYNNNYYLTTNVQVTANDHPEQLFNQLKDKEEQLIVESVDFPENTSVVSKDEIQPEVWKQTVKHATEQIKKHVADKIVLAREVRLELSKKAEPTAVLDQLAQTQPNSYIFAFDHGEGCFIGATPERLVKLEESQLLSTCLAGTAPRGETLEEDEKYKITLFNDQKNREEHDFVVQMIKNSMEDYCDNIDVPNEPSILQLRNLQHLYTPVRAKIKDGFSIFDVIDKLHPTPALGGTPREASLQFIRENEQLDRGWYGAPIGWLDSNQNGEFAVAIRSGLIQGKHASLFAGCGIVKDSDPEAEYEETTIKLLPMLSVLGGA